MDALTLETLRKFNQGKNSTHFDNSLGPGIYNVQFTTTLLGVLRKGKPSKPKRRNDSGSANIVRYLLDRLNPTEFAALANAIDSIRKGEYPRKQSPLYQTRLDLIMPIRELHRAGSTRFDGELILEDVQDSPTAFPETTKGLKIVSG
jgi:hypothetical protein